MAERIALFLDYQNVHLTGRDVFASGTAANKCLPDPARLADVIAAKRARPSVASVIKVYRGLPSPVHDPVKYAFNQAQAADWTRDRRVEVNHRPLRYYSSGQAREKGIDVAVAVDLVHMAMRNQFDALVLFSADSDLLPAIELIRSAGWTHTEVAAWRGGPRLRLPNVNVWCHLLDKADWSAVAQDWSIRPSPRP
jgi:uncharacterized LabA/DUF88 family protein